MIKMNKKALGLFWCLFFTTILIYSQEYKNNPNDFFSEEIIQKARTDGIIENIVSNDYFRKYSLAPKSDIGNLYSSYWKDNKETIPTYAVEILRYYKKSKKGNDITKCARILQMNSTMQGITYYSNTREKIEVLYPKAGTFTGYDNKKLITDQIQDNPNKKIGFLYLKDNTLGDIYNCVDYYMKDRQVAFRTSNLNSLYFTFFKVINTGDMNISIIVNDFDDEIFLYLLVESKNISFALLDEYFSRSFSARINAVYDWFVKMYEITN